MLQLLPVYRASSRIGHNLPSHNDLYTSMILRHAGKTMADPSHLAIAISLWVKTSGHQ